MNKIILFVSLCLLISCNHRKSEKVAELKEESRDSEKVVRVVDKAATRDSILYQNLDGKAVLLGSDMQLLGEDYKPIKDISSLNGQLVEITAVSKDFHKQDPKDDFCESFKYVKIKIEGLEGIVDGRKVYQFVQNEQGMSKSIGGSKVALAATKNFGIDAMDEEGLTGCSVRTPAVFSDEKAGYIGLVRMKKNKFYDADYPYFELKEDDGAGDEVENIEGKGGSYLISIKRTYQEGGAKLLVRIGREPDGSYTAEILNEELTEE